VGVTGYNVYKYDGMYSASLVATVTGTSYSGQPASGSGQFFFVRARDAAGNLSLTSNTAGNSSGLAPSGPPAPTPTCRVTYQVSSEWAHGFVANLIIANTGTTTVNGWTLGFAFGGGQKVVTSWAGDFTQSGSNVTLRPVHWTRTIAPGGRVDVGILGARTAGNPSPTAFTLNGSPCSAG
jgi:cellulose 1,4-beta-cellobiosidase